MSSQHKHQQIHTVLEKDFITVWGKISRFVLICLGAVLMAVNLNTFVHCGNLIPGGFTGATKLIQAIFLKYGDKSIPFSPFYLLFNLVPAAICFKIIGKRFTIYSCLMILLTSILTDLLPTYHITDDILLCSIFGGLVNSLAVTLCLVAGATSGGTDFIAIAVAERKGIDAWNYIMVGNFIILGISGYLFGWNSALYSMIFQFTSTQLLNYLYRRYQKVTMFLITNKPEELYHLINSETHHDATLFHGEGCYQKHQRDLLYSVVSGDEVRKLVPKIKKTDPDVFINIVNTKQLLGRFYRKPND